MAEIDLTKFEGHTPGPWAVGPWFDNDGQPEIIIEHATPRGNLVPAVALGGLIGQEANARLIAAAPDLLAEIKRQAAEIERLRGALADSNIAAHSLASRLTGLGVRIVNDRDLIDREEVMALVVRWRSMWDDALKESK